MSLEPEFVRCQSSTVLLLLPSHLQLGTAHGHHPKLKHVTGLLEQANACLADRNQLTQSQGNTSWKGTLAGRGHWLEGDTNWKEEHVF